MIENFFVICNPEPVWTQQLDQMFTTVHLLNKSLLIQTSRNWKYPLKSQVCLVIDLRKPPQLNLRLAQTTSLSKLQKIHLTSLHKSQYHNPNQKSNKLPKQKKKLFLVKIKISAKSWSLLKALQTSRKTHKRRQNQEVLAPKQHQGAKRSDFIFFLSF